MVLLRQLLFVLASVPAFVVAQSSVNALQRASDRAQQTHDQAATVDTTLFDLHAVEVRPEFPGGEVAMFTYVSKHFRYPTEAIEAGIGGRINLEFVIRATGQVTDVVVKRGLNAVLDAEAVRVIKSMPWWIPGKHNGRAVAVRYTLPISCVLPR